MALFSFGFGAAPGSDTSSLDIDLFPLSLAQKDFVSIDVKNIYMKILTDVLERTEGLKDEWQPLLWDNCLKSESPEGLVTLVADAMTSMTDLFLVYDKGVNLVRKATNEEQQAIKNDYATKAGASKIGVYISFKNYTRTDMLKIYSVLEYCTIGSLNKSMNLSKAIQIKINALRAAVGLNDAATAKAQAKEIAEALKAGKDTYMDKEDSIETSKPDLTATDASVELVNAKRSFYTGLPKVYFDGDQKGGLGDTGIADAKAVDRGLRPYFYSILKPVLDALFEIKVTFKPQDMGYITTGMELLKTLGLVDNEYLPKVEAQKLVNKVFDLPENTVGDAPAKVEPAAVSGQGQTKV